MKLISLVTLLLSTLTASAHVGSPNVFFDGRAGDYEVSVVIRPPAALPGMAQVSVRVNDSAVHAVTLLPVLWQSGHAGSPTAINAVRVLGETNFWSGEVWLLRPGSYQMEISVHGDEVGIARVPVTVLGLEAQAMTESLRATLLLLGVILIASAVLITRAIARDGGLAPGKIFTKTDLLRGRLSAALAMVILTAAITAGAVRWQKMDADYRTNGLQKPQPVNASVQREGDRMHLELRPPDDVLPGLSWAGLVPDHGKLMHLFLVRDPELDVFAHLHPIRIDAQIFRTEIPTLPGGDYQLYGDITFENGISQTLVTAVKLPRPMGPIISPPPVSGNFTNEVFCGYSTATNQIAGRDADDSWHVQRFDSLATKLNSDDSKELISRLMGGVTMRFENSGSVLSQGGGLLRFAVYDLDGRPVELQNYMGMRGHAVVRRQDGSVFAHLHPSGSFSMAAEEVFRRINDGGNSPMQSAKTNAAIHQVSFPYEFPKSGDYRLWIQVRVAGRVLTGEFDLAVP